MIWFQPDFFPSEHSAERLYVGTLPLLLQVAFSRQGTITLRAGVLPRDAEIVDKPLGDEKGNHITSRP
jgi:hypothetical protein